MVEVFRGISAVNLDAKGRLSIPSKYRDGLKGQSMVLTIDTEDPCLQLYPMSRWANIESQLEALPTFNPAARRIQRLLLGHATECELDSQSRILVPAVLREHAELIKKVMLVGQGKRFEIWSETLWSKVRQEWIEQKTNGSENAQSNVLDDIAL
ncbi:MAG: division/cell wall cluster transcriptional repressor MraZ [Gammaproteobacteria bacterium]|nr:division/cell wall cluster transcriptional repressor MraZ [Gammaproteobacteria bacterium]